MYELYFVNNKHGMLFGGTIHVLRVNLLIIRFLCSRFFKENQVYDLKIKLQITAMQSIKPLSPILGQGFQLPALN